MILGNCIPVLSRTTGKSFIVIIIIAMLAVLGLSTDASALATVATDTTEYWLGDSVDISGAEFWESENIFVRINELDGTLITSWNVTSDNQGEFITGWTVPVDGSVGDTLTITAYGESSGMIATTAIVVPPANMHQLQNGTTTKAANWSTGNINTNNSCYGEGSAIPFRYLINDVAAGSEHFFT
ncbi:MAG: hypothetical protein KAT85_05135, partial [candidate division Zixibacteria bacterium]|nr:hypothetical protein [candidate division Zixibacteria bacterium]